MLLPQRSLRGMFATAPAPPGREGEAGALVTLVALPPAGPAHMRNPKDRDRLLVLVGTGLRTGELCGLRRERVQVREGRLEVVTVRYDAGRFGRGYKHRPKSTAGIHVVPLAGAIDEVLGRRLQGERRSLLFPEATRYVLRHGYLRAVRQATKHGCLVGLDLRGPHDLWHTFATWLEDDGIPTRVIDELMGHAATRRPSWVSEQGSAMDAVYRHTTAEMGPGSSARSMPGLRWFEQSSMRSGDGLCTVCAADC
jgi:integrase